jgi:alpha,alpha-trehalase
MEHVERLGPVFAALHLSGLWPDGKVISDAILRAPAEEIAAAFAADPACDLRAFFARWFEPVGGAEAYRADPAHDALSHLEALWPYLTRPADGEERSSRIALPHPYVVVGGRFQEAYYWDSYFTQAGLLATGRHALVRDMIENFAWAIRSFGHIPNGFRSYFLTRSQPPFFPSMVRDYGRAIGDEAGALAHFAPEIEAEHRFFLDHRSDRGLAHYWDASDAPRVEMFGHDIASGASPERMRHIRAACESGWDFSSRWFGASEKEGGGIETIRAGDLWAVDLNALLLVNEEILFAATGREGFAEAAATRRAALQRFFDPSCGMFCDLDRATGASTGRVTAAGLFPLWAGAATADQAEAVAETVRQRLLAPGGLLTTEVASGEQWDAPNGWAPLQWIAIRGLQRAGQTALAEEIRRRWLATCEAVFAARHKFVEKYNVIDPLAPTGGGEYPLQDGFGWSNGVFIDLQRG